jgi:uncharacterized integral membrane protein/uncharacterized coiled-coil protein SlyX
MRYVILILMLLIALAFAIFGAQNTQAVNVHFLTYQTGTISLALVVVVAAVVGALLVSLLTMWIQLRYGLQNWRERRKNNSLSNRTSELDQKIADLTLENETLKATRDKATALETRTIELEKRVAVLQSENDTLRTANKVITDTSKQISETKNNISDAAERVADSLTASNPLPPKKPLA